jgi:pimeloyl-ACP methyl ester carboxylesterase
VASIYKSEAGRSIVEGMYRRALERWPVPHETRIVPTRHGDTFVVASGDPAAPPLVLFHGSGSNSSIWMRDVATWSQQHRVYAVDIIGEPGLSAPSRPPLASDAYAEWLDDVWDGLDIARASIVGISLGGWLALDYAVRRPARVASLSLISPSGVGAQNRLFLVKAGLLLRLGAWGRKRSFALVAGRHAAASPDVASFVSLIFRHFRPRMASLPIRTDEELASLRMPVQAMVGGKDVLLRSAETRDRLERLVPGAQVTWLADEGHVLPRQTDATATFLATVTNCGDRSRWSSASGSQTVYRSGLATSSPRSLATSIHCHAEASAGSGAGSSSVRAMNT